MPLIRHVNFKIFCGEQTLRRRRSLGNETIGMMATIAVHIPLPASEEALDFGWLKTLKRNFSSFVETIAVDLLPGVNVSFIGVTSGGISTLCDEGYVPTPDKTGCCKITYFYFLSDVYL